MRVDETTSADESTRPVGRGRDDRDARCERLTSVLLERIGARRFDLWFGPAAARLSVDADGVRIDTASQYVADWITRHFAVDVAFAARATLDDAASVRIEVSPTSFTRSAPPAPGAFGRDRPEARRSETTLPAPPADDRPASRRKDLIARRPTLRRLDDFVVGPSNQLALDAGRRIAEDGDGAPTLLFVHGDCGVGKTHLLQGICDRRAGLAPRQRIRYTTAEQFTNEYLAALRDGSLEQFRKSLRRVDLLAIDDIHFLSNKTATQSEFLHTMDAIDLSGARIVLASDEHPRTIRKFSQQLISRFLSGMVVRIDRPDRETRVRLVQALARDRGLDLQPAAEEIIANRCVGSVREIEGALTRVAAFARLGLTGDLPVPSTAESDPTESVLATAVGAIVAEHALAHEGGNPRGPVRIAEIVDAVCRRVAATRDEIMGSGRTKRAVLARGIVVHLARELTSQSFPEIARALGRDGHSTVHTAAKRVEQLVATRERIECGDPTVADRDGRAPIAEVLAQLRHDLLRRGNDANRNGGDGSRAAPRSDSDGWSGTRRA
ncbi:MAG: ATP-binding protein [Phycisphaerae bacterium]|nr:ATP-binding protein [Phycisphaerae bacterium]